MIRTDVLATHRHNDYSVDVLICHPHMRVHKDDTSHTFGVFSNLYFLTALVFILGKDELL